MKRLEELGISPTPWGIVASYCNESRVFDRENKPIHYDDIYTPDARLIAAAPKLYAALFDAFQSVCYNDGRCDGCAYASDCRAKPWRAALAEAAGEEASDGER